MEATSLDGSSRIVPEDLGESPVRQQVLQEELDFLNGHATGSTEHRHSTLLEPSVRRSRPVQSSARADGFLSSSMDRKTGLLRPFQNRGVDLALSVSQMVLQQITNWVGDGSLASSEKAWSLAFYHPFSFGRSACPGYVAICRRNSSKKMRVFRCTKGPDPEPPLQAATNRDLPHEFLKFSRLEIVFQQPTAEGLIGSNPVPGFGTCFSSSPMSVWEAVTRASRP